MQVNLTSNQPMPLNSGHIPVMFNSVIKALNIKPSGIYVDCTFGRGGHSEQILNSLAEDGRLLIIDKDIEAIEYARNKFKNDNRVYIEHSSFSKLILLLEKYGFNARVDGVLVDLGVSSNQLDTPSRGFSFMKDGPLDMRMNQMSGQSAEDWLNHTTEIEMANVFNKYAQHPKAKLIAKEIVMQRKVKPFESTLDLAHLLEKKFNNPREKKHPATLIFQAIRIEINQELDDLDLLLTQIPDILNSKGRFVALSFHSLEDRLVKRLIQSTSHPNAWLDKHDYLTELKKPVMKNISKKMASHFEISQNPRSRSVVMRVAEKI